MSDDRRDLSGYKVQFWQDILTHVWTWEMKNPNGDSSFGAQFASLEHAEEDALYWMERDIETPAGLDGEALRQRVEERREAA